MPPINTLVLEGISESSWGEAAREALREAAKTIRNITEMEVLHWTAVIEGGRIKEYHAHMRLNFRLER